MRKRLRKKRRLGEFRQFGFEVTFRLAPEVSEAAVDRFWDRFIVGCIERHHLTCGGGCGREWDVFVTPEGRRSATELDRELTERWLRGQAEVVDLQVGPLIDAWHAA